MPYYTKDRRGQSYLRPIGKGCKTRALYPIKPFGGSVLGTTWKNVKGFVGNTYKKGKKVYDTVTKIPVVGQVADALIKSGVDVVTGVANTVGITPAGVKRAYNVLDSSIQVADKLVDKIHDSKASSQAKKTALEKVRDASSMLESMKTTVADVATTNGNDNLTPTNETGGFVTYARKAGLVSYAGKGKRSRKIRLRGGMTKNKILKELLK